MPNAVVMLTVVLSTLVVLSDLYARRVPNAWLLGALVLGLVLPLAIKLLGLGQPEWPSVSGLVIGLLVMLPFYALGWMGAGDVKFLAVLGFLLGARALLPIWVIGSLLTGVHVAVLLLARMPGLAQAPAFTVTRDRLTSSPWWQRMQLARRGRVGQPHAAYLAIGALLTIAFPTLQAWGTS
ncbi:prepilin peptidase [Dyella sp. ASV21]|uniref:A24 family peptidase n=1 Tax=Dyella sp. ASV21 TaxID=2795114 RepID=UPI001E33A558|nr:prepilin peptidase [Dyella sp. ASV21]